MSETEFLNSFGPPQNAVPVSETIIAQCRGRLPDSLLGFWSDYGIGTYAQGTFRMCTPQLFDPLLDWLLARVPELAGRLAAFGYDAYGNLELWHTDARHFVLVLQDGMLLDQTSRIRTYPSSIGATGMVFPDDDTSVVETDFREDIWKLMTSCAVAPELEGDDLLAPLLKLKGPLEQDEIFWLRPNGAEDEPKDYDKITLQQAFKMIEPSVAISSAYIEGNQQKIRVTEFPAG